MVQERQRPLGVTLIALLSLVQGAIGLCCPLLVWTGAGLAAGLGGFIGISAGVVGFIIGAIMIIGPALHLIFAMGAWNLLNWAWWLGIIASGLSVLGVVLNVLNGAEILPAVIGSALSIVIFIYLLLPGTREAFQ